MIDHRGGPRCPVICQLFCDPVVKGFEKLCASQICNKCNFNNNTCGNGVVDPGETCDTAIAAGSAGACPTSCDDGDHCTTDVLQNPGTCMAQCTHTAVTACTAGDGCCAPGCNNNNDADCPVVCGNGAVETGETCDTGIAAGKTGACPTSCDDGDHCTTDTLNNGGTCTASCSHTAVTQCMDGDGCCPSGCTTANDSDCQPACGNGIVDPGETCDTGIKSGPGSCPTSCNDGDSCTTDSLQNAGTCTAQCTTTPVTTCSTTSDGCCPSGCNANTDADCKATCGNGVVETGETCDTGIAAGKAGACPTSCNDGDSCTTDTLVGAGSCTAHCTTTPVTMCAATTDGCCPSGCNANNDGDCQPKCGNGVVEPGESCDTGIAAGQPGACPTSCNDGNSCTTDTLTNAGTCTATCTETPVTACKSGDGCCPSGCTNANDNDCAAPVITLAGDTFVSHVVTTGTISVPLIGANAANIDIVLRIFSSASGSNLNSHLEFCRVNTASTNGNLVVNIPTNITALLVNDQTTPNQNLTVGGAVTLPTFSITLGQDASGNSVDADHDGNPGVSIPTLLQGSNETAFSSLVISLSFPSATLTDANTISGVSAQSVSGKVFGGTPLNLTGSISVTTDTQAGLQPGQVAFTSTRVTGNAACSTVLAMFPTN